LLPKRLARGRLIGCNGGHRHRQESGQHETASEPPATLQKMTQHRRPRILLDAVPELCSWRFSLPFSNPRAPPCKRPAQDGIGVVRAPRCQLYGADQFDALLLVSHRKFPCHSSPALYSFLGSPSSRRIASQPVKPLCPSLLSGAQLNTPSPISCGMLTRS